MQKIGFIGLGIMGKPMAKNLAKHGYDVMVNDHKQSAMDELVALGAIDAQSVREVAENCQVIITMLPNSPQVRSVVLEEGGIIYYAKPGTLIIDMSSIAPAASKEMYDELRKKEIHIIDAPVSGGEPKAIDGTLAIMVGGDKSDYEKAVPIFEVLGSTAVLVGDIGSGNTCKLTNQVIVALNIAALSEGMMLAKMAGTDPAKVFSAIRAGLAGSTVMDAKTPMILADEFKPGFRIDLHIKDLKNAVSTGDKFHSPLPMTKDVLDILNKLSENGNGLCDHSAIAKHYEELAGRRFAE